MKLLPYLNFNGNCVKALAFYEKVFGVKSESFMWRDMLKFDPNASVPKDKEKWIMHASMKLAYGAEIQFADCDEHGEANSTNICLQLTYKTAEEVNSIYNALKSGGRVLCKLSPTFYAPLYCDLVDKFGIRWSIMQENPAQ